IRRSIVDGVGADLVFVVVGRGPFILEVTTAGGDWKREGNYEGADTHVAVRRMLALCQPTPCSTARSRWEIGTVRTCEQLCLPVRLAARLAVEASIAHPVSHAQNEIGYRAVVPCFETGNCAPRNTAAR